MRFIKEILKELKKAFALNAVLEIFYSDAHSIISREGLKKLNQKQ